MERGRSQATLWEPETKPSAPLNPVPSSPCQGTTHVQEASWMFQPHPQLHEGSVRYPPEPLSTYGIMKNNNKALQSHRIV